MSRTGAKGEEARPYLFDRVLEREQDEEEIRRDVERLRKEGYEEGFRRGVETGYREGIERAAGVLSRLQALTSSLERGREELYGRLEQEILEVVFRIAEKVIHHEIRTDPSARSAVLTAGLRKLKEKEKVLVRVHPADLAVLKEHLPEIRERSGFEGKVLFQADAGITEGGCLIESDECELDARIETTLKRIEEALREG